MVCAFLTAISQDLLVKVIQISLLTPFVIDIRVGLKIKYLLLLCLLRKTPFIF